MKILLSPSKTMNIKSTEQLPKTQISNQTKTEKIVDHIKSLSKKDLQAKMSLSEKQVDDVYQYYLDFAKASTGQAILSYTGFVYKKLNFAAYKQDHYDYIEEHVRILDALYGLLRPSTMIKEYRLDFQTKLDLPLYDMWDVSQHINDDVIINLASKEYRKMVEHCQLIDISFYQKKNGKLKNIPTYTKQARGLMLDYMILNTIDDVKQLKAFDIEGYTYSQDLSSAQELVFLR